LLPCVLGRHGVSHILEPDMSEDKRTALQQSADKIRNALAGRLRLGLRKTGERGALRSGHEGFFGNHHISGADNTNDYQMTTFSMTRAGIHFKKEACVLSRVYVAMTLSS